jgi:tetratricopeptide (TPR) repeat protein
MMRLFGSRLLFLLNLAVFSANSLSFSEAAPDPALSIQETVDAAFQLLNQGETQNALMGFQNALEADQNNLQACLGQAMIFNKLERYPEAFAAYDSLTERLPQNAFAWNGRGLAAFNLEQFDEALNSFQNASEMTPSGHHFESLAWTQMCRGEFNEAAESAKRANLFYTREGEQTLYPLLLAYFAHLEAGEAEHARRTLDYTLANLPRTGWPLPVLHFIIGKSDAAELISHVRTAAQETEAHTYLGLYWRAQNAPEIAKQHLDWVRQNGDASVFEYILARALPEGPSLAMLQPAAN